MMVVQIEEEEENMEEGAQKEDGNVSKRRNERQEIELDLLAGSLTPQSLF